MLIETRKLTTDDLMAFGLKVLRTAKDPTDEQDLAFTGRTIMVMNMLARGIDMSVHPAEISETELTSVGTAQWARNGFPTIEIGHKFAAALLVSNITSDLLENLKRPWSSFMITMPSNLLFITDEGTKESTPICRILVFQCEGLNGNWAYIAYGVTGITIWRHGVSPAMLLPPADDDNEFIPNARGSFEFTDLDHRAQVLVGRLIITTCAAMTMNGMSQPTGKGHDTHNQGRKTGEIPLVPSMFKLGKPIEIDFRDRVSEFVTGKREGQKLEARHMVCGHFKRQHFGPKNVNVKVMWREPVWRGPADAPVLVRPHLLNT